MITAELEGLESMLIFRNNNYSIATLIASAMNTRKTALWIPEEVAEVLEDARKPM